MRCEGSGEFTHWGSCGGGIVPSLDICDSLDNDCNGCADDNPACCTVLLACPDSASLPEAAPFTAYTMDASGFYTGTVSSYTWTISGGPCDELLAPSISWTLDTSTPGIAIFTPTLSGSYTVTVTMVTPTGTVSCTFVVHVRGPGLRVELCWDKTGPSALGGADIDLHVHDSATTPWFTTALTGYDYNPDDCYYANCTASDFYSGGTTAEWGFAGSPLAECGGGPEGSTWALIGGATPCHNPRLDMDNVSTVGKSENINLDNPANGDSYRIMVHYYSGASAGYVKPLVNIYCGGALTATYGASPDALTNFDTPGSFGGGDMWRVADVVMNVSGGTTTGCSPTALHPASGTGYWVTTGDRSY
jgi:hypothetical protein